MPCRTLRIAKTYTKESDEPFSADAQHWQQAEKMSAPCQTLFIFE